MKINYALQTYDIASNSCFDRYCTNDKRELVQKCVSSFFRAIEYASKQNDYIHNVKIFDNGSSEITISLLNKIIDQISSEKIIIKIDKINTGSMIKSIKECFNWLKTEEGDIVYLVQDDYLYTETSIHEMLDIYCSILKDYSHECIVYPFNTPDHWKVQYRGRSTPRSIHLGCKQYWIQCYDISCCFMTGKNQLKNKWDTIKFFTSIDQINGIYGNLENISLNTLLVHQGILGLMPFESVALHMQGEREKEPFVNWKQRWEAVKDY